MAERVGNPVPDDIRRQLDRHETPLVYELVTRPKDPGGPAPGTWAARFAAVVGTDDQHELLLTRQRLMVVSTDRRTKDAELVLSVPLDEVAGVESDSTGLERGRVRFTFRDGSETYGVMGLVLPRPARRFLAAYETTVSR